MKPALTFLIVATAAMAAPSIVEARPHRARPKAHAARPLVRARPAPATAAIAPLVTPAARPVCGNVVTKGGARRDCTDPVGTSHYGSFGGGPMKFEGRSCEQGELAVYIDGTGQATLTGPTRLAGAYPAGQSPHPLIAACRVGAK